MVTAYGMTLTSLKEFQVTIQELKALAGHQLSCTALLQGALMLKLMIHFIFH